jgi:hypothetical protein
MAYHQLPEVCFFGNMLTLRFIILYTIADLIKYEIEHDEPSTHHNPDSDRKQQPSSCRRSACCRRA